MRTQTREHFCQLVAQMIPVKLAYQRAGYGGTDQARSELRRSADVDARISWLLANRVNEDTKARLGREKKIEDSRLRLLREVERLALSNIGELVQWDRKPVVDPSTGDVTGYEDVLLTTPSKRLSRSTLAAVKSVTTKSGALKVELHGKDNPLNLWAKILGMGVDAAPVTVTVNTVNVGEAKAVEVSRRLSFLLETARLGAPTIEGELSKPDTSE